MAKQKQVVAPVSELAAALLATQQTQQAAQVASTESKLSETQTKEWAEKGASKAAEFIKAIGGEGLTRAGIMLYVAEIPMRLEAEQFVKGWKDYATKNAEDKGKAGEELYDAAKNAESFAGTLGRVVRSVFGVRKQNEQTKKMETVYFKGFDSGKDAQAAGRETVIKLLKGPGSINRKIEALGTKKERTENNDPVQRRIALGAEMKQDGNAEDFAKAVGIAHKDEATRDKMSLGVMLSGIKLVPEVSLEHLVRTMLDRARISRNVGISEWAINARKELDAVVNKPVPVMVE